MRRFYIGIVMIAAGLVALEEAQARRPPASTSGRSRFDGHALATITLHSTRPTWSRAVYDIVSFGGWALLIVGVVVIVRGLLARARDLSDPPTV